MAYDYSQEGWYEGYDWGDDWTDEWDATKDAKPWKGKSGTGRLRWRRAMIKAYQDWLNSGNQSWDDQGDQGDSSDAAQDELHQDLIEAINSLSDVAGQNYSIDWSGGAPVVVDHEGTVIQDFAQYQDQIDELKNMDIPSMQEYAESMGLDISGANADMQDIIGMFTDPGQQAADEQAAQDYFHQLAGINDPDYMQNLLSDLDAGVANQEGLSDAERQVYERAGERQVQRLERSGDRQIDAVMGSYGSQMRGLAAAESVRQQIGDAQVQNDLAILQEDQARKQYNYEAKWDRYNTMLQMGQITQQQYMDGLRSDRMNALQGYASQIDAMSRNYTAEVDGLRAHADIMYNTLMADLGISQAALDFGNNWYQSQIAPYLNQIQAYTAGISAIGNQEMQDKLDEILADL